jgi:hypothetical protein
MSQCFAKCFESGMVPRDAIFTTVQATQTSISNCQGCDSAGTTTLRIATANTEAAAEPVGLFALGNGADVTLLSGAGTVDSGDIIIGSNPSAVAFTGDVFVSSGDLSAGTQTGALDFATGRASGVLSTTSGPLNLATGDVVSTSGVSSGDVRLESGQIGNLVGTSGSVSVLSGAVLDGVGTSGNILMTTGSAFGTLSATSGRLDIQTGGVLSTSGASSGNLSFSSGFSQGTSSGDVTVASGQCSVSPTGRSGALFLQTGRSGTSQKANNIYLGVGRGFGGGGPIFPVGEVVIGDITGNDVGRHLVAQQQNPPSAVGATVAANSSDMCGQVTMTGSTATIRFRHAYTTTPFVLINQFGVAPNVSTMFVSTINPTDFIVDGGIGGEIVTYLVIGNTAS